MKLYFSPGSCSLASHIVLQELGLSFTTERVDLRTKKTAQTEFSKINPKGYVPTLQLDTGEILTEGAAILQYLGDQRPELKLVPASGTLERYRLQEWLNFVATEIHKGFSPLWNDAVSDEMKMLARERLFTRFDYLSNQLKQNQFLMGDHYTVADAYLFTVLSWSEPLKIDLSRWPTLRSYVERVRVRPSVQAALKAEGLLKAA